MSGSQSRRFPETSKVWIFSRFPIELGSSVSWFSLRKSMRNFEHFPILGVNSSSLLRPTWRTVKWDKFPTDSGKTERQFSVKTSSESSRQLPILSDKWRILFWSILSKIIHFRCFLNRFWGWQEDFVDFPNLNQLTLTVFFSWLQIAELIGGKTIRTIDPNLSWRPR